MWASQVALVVKKPPASAGARRHAGLILEWVRCPGGRHGKPLQYSCLENPMDRGAWWATVHGVAKSRTRLSNFTFTFTLGGWRSSQGSGRGFRKAGVGWEITRWVAFSATLSRPFRQDQWTRMQESWVSSPGSAANPGKLTHFPSLSFCQRKGIWSPLSISVKGKVDWQCLRPLSRPEVHYIAWRISQVSHKVFSF